LFCFVYYSFFWETNSQNVNTTIQPRNATQEAIEYAAFAKLRSDYTANETLYYQARISLNVSKFERGNMVSYFHPFDFRNIKTLLRTWYPNDYVVMHAKIDTTNPSNPQILKNSGGLTKVTRMSTGQYKLEYEELKLLSEVYPYFSIISTQTLNYRLEESPTLTECTILFLNKLDIPSDPNYFYVQLMGY
jgi:hypothetical protein